MKFRLGLALGFVFGGILAMNVLLIAIGAAVIATFWIQHAYETEWKRR